MEIAYDKDIVESIVPNPASMPYILKGEIANFYVTFKGQLDKPTTISLQYEDSSNNLPFKGTVEVSPESPSECYVDKMGRFRSIKALEESEEAGGNIEEYLYFVKEVDKRKEIIEQSVKHQILSKYTAFVCVEEELVDGKYQ